MAWSPLTTVTHLVLDALGAGSRRDARWARAAFRAFTPGDIHALGPVLGPCGPRVVPPCLLPRPEAGQCPVDEELEHLAHVDPLLLVDEVQSEGLAGSSWATVLQAPARWLRAYVGAVTRVSHAVAPLLCRAEPLVDREVERVGVALVRGHLVDVLEGLSPTSTVVDGRWLLGGGEVTVDNHLTLVPMAVPPDATLVGRDGGHVSHLAYPLPGAGDVGDATGHDHPTLALDALLGPPRAAVLRLLDDPMTAGDLARSLGLVPSAVSHHLNALERGGLVHRERAGRSVRVSRSARGTSLLHLYGR
jgi:DNA-binding transcriptional ArsR family regulator